MARRRILILMSNTGSGHRASALALRAELKRAFDRQVRVSIIDLLSDYLPPPLRYAPNAYPFLSQDAPWMWKSLWQLDMRIAAPAMRTAARAARHSVLRTLQAYNPDLIISVHPLVQHLVAAASRQRFPSIPFVTVVTDLGGIHPLWFHRSVTRCYVPNDDAYQLACRSGLLPGQVRNYGLPIRPGFGDRLHQRMAIRRELGLLPEEQAVLLMGNGVKRARVIKTARSIARGLGAGGEGRGQLVIICGRNERLVAELSAISWPAPTRILGFVEEMATWMQACDCMVTKAGPGTIAEAMASGLPLILNGYIPGQEAGNVTYVVEQGAGRYLVDPNEAAHQVTCWFTHEQAEMELMAQRALTLARPHATRDIVADLGALLDMRAYSPALLADDSLSASR
ncbi:MAG: glycosyltransferase [Caldilineaceae bacterium]|nr:glycosyltransferase [Caldilineaceae bacterium]